MKPKESKSASGIAMIAKNREAFHQYFISDKYEAGIQLKGSEVKSIRDGKINLKEGYAWIKNGELFLEGVHISPYKEAGPFNHDPVRTRKLLMHKREIDRLHQETTEKRLALVPLSIYFKSGKAKIELGLGRGKKLHDKRESIKKKDMDRQLDQVHKRRPR